MEKFQEVLAEVRKLEEEIQKLAEKQDRLLDPILVQVMRDGNRAEAEYLIRQLPFGFHRTEMQVWLIWQGMEPS